MKLKLFLISQETNIRIDSYEKMVICAESKEQAQHFNPESGKFDLPDSVNPKNCLEECCGAKPVSVEETWTGAKNVSVEEIGLANRRQKPGIVVGSFYGV